MGTCDFLNDVVVVVLGVSFGGLPWEFVIF